MSSCWQDYFLVWRETVWVKLMGHMLLTMLESPCNILTATWVISPDACWMERQYLEEWNATCQLSVPGFEKLTIHTLDTPRICFFELPIPWKRANLLHFNSHTVNDCMTALSAWLVSVHVTWSINPCVVWKLLNAPFDIPWHTILERSAKRRSTSLHFSTTSQKTTAPAVYSLWQWYCNACTCVQWGGNTPWWRHFFFSMLTALQFDPIKSFWDMIYQQQQEALLIFAMRYIIRVVWIINCSQLRCSKPSIIFISESVQVIMDVRRAKPMSALKQTWRYKDESLADVHVPGLFWRHASILTQNCMPTT